MLEKVQNMLVPCYGPPRVQKKGQTAAHRNCGEWQVYCKLRCWTGDATTLSSQTFLGPVLGFFAGPPGAWWPPCFPSATQLEEAGGGWCELWGLAG